GLPVSSRFVMIMSPVRILVLSRVVSAPNCESRASCTRSAENFGLSKPRRHKLVFKTLLPRSRYSFLISPNDIPHRRRGGDDQPGNGPADQIEVLRQPKVVSA